MRIHWAIVTITALGVLLLTWHIRTREIDFMTPREFTLPPEDFGSDLAAGPSSIQPAIAAGPKSSDQVTPISEGPEEPEIPEISDEDLGDLETSPGLDSYRSYARSNDPDRLFLLSSTLRTRGEFQRALLAFERVIDSTTATSQQLLEAGQGIAALAPTLPRWNVDPIAEIPITLEIGIPSEADEAIQTAALELADLIRKHSGDLLEITPKINSPKTEATIENPPIALWFSTTGKNPISSAVLTMTPKGGEAELLEQFSMAAFQTVRSHLSKLGYALPPPLEASGIDLLTLQITRLMWRDFVQSLYQEQDKPAEESATGEN